MESKIIIRRATESDIEIVQQFGYELLDFERKNWDNSLDPKWPFTESGKQKYLEAIKDKYTIIAEMDGKSVGFLIGKIIKAPAGGARHLSQARVENIYLNEGVRGSGIGAKLIENFRDFCYSNDVNRLDVSVLADNEAAVEFYKKMGFKPRSLNLSQEL